MYALCMICIAMRSLDTSYVPCILIIITTKPHSPKPQTLTHTVPHTTPTSATAVTTHAPTRSPNPGPCPHGPSFALLFPAVVDPALGSPSLVPPSSSVTGPCTSSIKFVCSTSSAAICWPTPSEPSQTPRCAHFRPQTRPLPPPQQCAMAAAAEERRSGLMAA